jgi:16S rRNA A1518/A1519 N6-dimethyltransferase RsmA/KsgA/DIM1 with predicted DNA glycosylase/AP lyase activity
MNRKVDFESVIEPQEVGLDPNLVNRSSPSGNEFLANVLMDLKITKEDTIIDIGCGLGSAMSIMLRFSFKKIAGIEISECIAKRAENNFRILRDNRCIIYNQNAITFPNYSEYNYFYMYNPFPCQIVTGVMHKINQQKGLKKERFIIYNNPRCHQIICDNGWDKIKEFPNSWIPMTFIYKEKEK